MRLMGAKLALVQRGVALSVLLLASAAQGEYRHDYSSSRSEGRNRSLMSTSADDVGLTNIPHIEFDPSKILPPPMGFEPYMEYGGTFKVPDKDFITPDYFDPIKLNAKGIHSVDSFLSNLPGIFKKRVVAVNRTASTHKSDDMHPRFIMHNYEPNGRSVDNHPLDIIAVGTDPTDPAVNKIERITYDPRTRQFIFSALDLVTNKPPEPPTVTVLETESCKNCHTEHLRPNFDPAHNWSSVIGVRERFNIFDKDESALMAQMHEQNPIANKHFTMDALLGRDEQTPATVFFYALFGPVQAYVSDNMVKNQQYGYNKLSVVKVLANCKDEIKNLKDRAPNFFANKRLEISQKVPKFNFQLNAKGEPILNADGQPVLNYEPVLVEEYTDQITALVSLLKTNTDVDEIGWLGKTSKIKEMYTHAFSKQDFDMLIGGLCERDESVKNLLIKHGADTSNPCYDKNNASRDLCEEASTPAFQAPVVANAVKQIDSTTVQPCVRNFGGQTTRTYCVGEGIEQRHVMWNEKDGFYFCKNDPNATACPGNQQKVDQKGADMILDAYVEMEKQFQAGVAMGSPSNNTYRNMAQRELALRATYQERRKSLEAVARGGQVLPPTTQTNLQRCAYQGAQGYCVTVGGVLRLVRWEPTTGFQYCSRGETNCSVADRMPLPEAAREALLAQYEQNAHAAEKANPDSKTKPALQTASQRIYYHYKGKTPPKAGPNPTPNPGPGPTPNPKPGPKPNPGPNPGPATGLQAAREAAAEVIKEKCLSCHGAFEGQESRGFDYLAMPATVDAEYMGKSLKGEAQKILDFVSLKTPQVMPPRVGDKEQEEIVKTIAAWVKAETGAR